VSRAVKKIEGKMKSDIARPDLIIFWRARRLLALWHLLKGFFVFINYFQEKEGFLISCIVYIK
jgi:hypothetical protein